MHKNIVIAALVVFGVAASSPSQAGKASARTCSGQHSICLNFCSTSGRGGDCTSDCAGRQATCLQTGTYMWINSPTIRGLVRK